MAGALRRYRMASVRRPRRMRSATVVIVTLALLGALASAAGGGGSRVKRSSSSSSSSSSRATPSRKRVKSHVPDKLDSEGVDASLAPTQATPPPVIAPTRAKNIRGSVVTPSRTTGTLGAKTHSKKTSRSDVSNDLVRREEVQEETAFSSSSVVSTSGSTRSSPSSSSIATAKADNLVLIGTSDGALHAMDTVTGKQKWTISGGPLLSTTEGDGEYEFSRRIADIRFHNCVVQFSSVLKDTSHIMCQS